MVSVFDPYGMAKRFCGAHLRHLKQLPMSAKCAVRNVTAPSRDVFRNCFWPSALWSHIPTADGGVCFAQTPLYLVPTFCFCQVCAGGLTKATQVLEHLWLSGQEVTGDKCGLQREGVTHIVNCSIRLANFYPKDFSYHRVSWADESGQVREMAAPVRRAR